MGNNKRPRILYLYAGSRKAFYEKWKDGKNPDTQLLGLNYMKELGVDATFIEFPFAEWLRKINFNLVHLPYLFAIRRYDVIFIGAGLPLVFVAKHLLGWKKPKFVIYNTFLKNALERNPHGLLGYITKKAVENIDSIICTSKTQEKFLLEYGLPKKKITFAPIGIDVRAFLAAGEKFQTTKDYIISVGRDLGRDYATLFKAVEGLRTEVKVLTKKEAIADLTIPKNVTILQNVPYEDVPKLHAEARFAVVPLYDDKNTSGSDTSGQYGYLEPMAAGKAVIVSNRATVRDYIEDGTDGILVPPGDPKALREQIEKLLSNPEKAAALGAAAKAKVIEHFTSKKFAKFLATQFKKLAI